jgi:dipeptidyl aminopeptidase/acylaminoacyl peptidase
MTRRSLCLALLGAGLLLITWPATAQPPSKRALTLEDYYRVESVSSPAMSPDGRRVAFVRSVILEEENRRHSEIWIAPSDGSAPPRRLTSPAFSASGPQWSPDGTLLAFTSRRALPGSRADEGGSIWFLRMDEPSGEAFQIPGVTAAPIFSPDSRWIAMLMVDPDRPKVAPKHASDFDKKIAERFKGRIFDWMNYRFDQRGYLPDPRDPNATPPREIFLAPREGGTPKKLTDMGVAVQSAAWRPDGNALAFVADTHQRDEYSYERADVFVSGLDGSVQRLTDDGYDHGTLAWSPDGTALVFNRQQSLNQILEAKQRFGSPDDLFKLSLSGRGGPFLARADARAGPPVNLTANWDYVPGEVAFSPDGRFLYFSAGVSGATHLFRVPAGGGAVEAVTRGARRLGGFSFSSGFDRMAYTSETPAVPGEVFASKADGSGETRLSAFNDKWLNGLELAPAEPIRYASKDGTPIEGWVLMPPAASQAPRPVPLILNIHGGPHGAYGCEFSFQRQLWAARGYAVVYTNPRGSTEYGEKFLWATWGGWGNLDYEDVMGGVDETIRKYPIDPKRLAVTGYSYGGFLTNWIITKTSRFAAAIVGAGISNWISDYGTADIPRTKETEFNGPPWDPTGNQTLRKQSPIEYVGNATTPALFIHGEADLRVPIEEAEQMYTALKKRKVPAKFVRYPDSYHGGWTPWNTVHRYDQELKWWEQYLRARR